MRPTKPATSLLISIAALALVGGCRTSETVYVPSGEPMRLAEPIRARVSVDNGKGVLVESPNRVQIPNGWWVIPDLGTDGEGPTTQP